MAASNHATNPAILPKIPYDTLRDLTGVMLVAEGPHVLVANPKVPFATVEDLVAYAKANPDKLLYSSSGRGGTVHFAGAMFEEAAGVERVLTVVESCRQQRRDVLAFLTDSIRAARGGTKPPSLIPSLTAAA